MNRMSNAIGRRYFLHANDVSADNTPACYFSQTGDEDGWGFWVARDGSVDVDDVSANGELPSERILAACVVAAKKRLASSTAGCH